MIATIERPFRIDEDVGDVLDVAHLVYAATNLNQWIVMDRAGVGGIEQQAMQETGTPASGQFPILALDIVDDGRAGPSQQSRHDKADTLAASSQRERHDMLGTVMTQIASAKAAEEKTSVIEQRGARHLA